MTRNVVDINEKMITCCECHGNGFCIRSDFEKDGCVQGKSKPCAFCHGVGKITLKFYESLQQMRKQT